MSSIYPESGYLLSVQPKKDSERCAIHVNRFTRWSRTMPDTPPLYISIDRLGQMLKTLHLEFKSLNSRVQNNSEEITLASLPLSMGRTFPFFAHTDVIHDQIHPKDHPMVQAHRKAYRQNRIDFLTPYQKIRENLKDSSFHPPKCHGRANFFQNRDKDKKATFMFIYDKLREFQKRYGKEAEVYFQNFIQGKTPQDLEERSLQEVFARTELQKSIGMSLFPPGTEIPVLELEKTMKEFLKPYMGHFYENPSSKLCALKLFLKAFEASLYGPEVIFSTARDHMKRELFFYSDYLQKMNDKQKQDCANEAFQEEVLRVMDPYVQALQTRAQQQADSQMEDDDMPPLIPESSS